MSRMKLFQQFKNLHGRYQKNEENIRTVLFRPFFWPNKFLKDGKRVLKEEWDYLIVLDACRYDLFKEVNHLPGKLEEAYSVGSHTVEWLKNNFAGKKADDIVYISGNPQVSPPKLKEWTGSSNPFHHLENVWDWGWDSNLKTVKPSKVIDAALKLKNKYPDKRMIIHFLQPHAPFIGKEKFEMSKKEVKIFNSCDWRPLLNSENTIDDIWRAYKSNLEFVLEEVEKLVSKLEGRVVITADHGEMFGEYGVYGHIPGFYSKVLIRVPWFFVL